MASPSLLGTFAFCVLFCFGRNCLLVLCFKILRSFANYCIVLFNSSRLEMPPVIEAIKSFASGVGPGPDGLRADYLKALVQPTCDPH